MLIRVKVSMLTMEGKELTSYREEAKCAAGSVWKSRGRELGHFLNGHSLRDVYVVAEFDCGEGKVLYEDAVFVPRDLSRAVFAGFFARYEAAKEMYGRLDFDDMLYVLR